MKMPNSQYFVIAEIHTIDVKALFFKILKIPMGKFRSLGKHSVCSKKFPRGNRFYRGLFLNVFIYQHFLGMLSEA